MPKQRMQTRLSKRDIEFIIAMVEFALRHSWTVAQVVQHRLSQNETGLITSLEDADDAMHRQIASETRRIHRLMRRFASWQAPTS
jgi:hypothetical protein